LLCRCAAWFQTISVKLTRMRSAGRSAATKISNEASFEQ
jgi:hypothetical protein